MARILLRELSDADLSSALRFLTQQEVPKSVERQAVAAINRDVVRREREELKRTQEGRRLTRKARNALREAFAASLTEGQLQEAKSVVRLAAKQAPSSRRIKPKAEKEEASIKFGSLEATLSPPYDFWWAYDDGYGPSVRQEDADKSDGTLFSFVKAPQDGDESNGYARAAVGIFFKPVYNGTVRFGAKPVIDYWWYDGAVNADAKSRGAVGLQVYRFKLDGTLDPSPNNPPFDTHEDYATADFELWYDDSGGADVQVHQGQTTPTITIDFAVSKNRFYNLWCYQRASASADGGGWAWQSEAVAWMAGTVPSMKWKFET